MVSRERDFSLISVHQCLLTWDDIFTLLKELLMDIIK